MLPDQDLSAALSPDEDLLRRFSPTNPDQVTTDEGSGKPLLNWAALKFDEDGCSVYRERILTEDGLTAGAILEEPYIGLASTTPEKVRCFTYGTGHAVVSPFFAVASPRTQLPPMPTDRAHASIRIRDDHGLTERQLDKAKRHLGRTAFTVRN